MPKPPTHQLPELNAIVGLPKRELPKLGPEQAKVVALRLPMKTIGDFLDWLGRRYPHIMLAQVDTTLALYEYYNIDPQALAEEEKQQAPD